MKCRGLRRLLHQEVESLDDSNFSGEWQHCKIVCYISTILSFAGGRGMKERRRRVKLTLNLSF